MSVSAQHPDDAAPSGPAKVVQVDVGALYLRYKDQLRAHALRYLPGHLHHEVGAALMAVFARLVAGSAGGRLEEQPNWEAYLKHAVKNACLDILKAERGDQEIDPDDPQTHRGTTRDPTGDTAADRVDDLRRVPRARKALEALDSKDPRLRVIVIGKLVDERTNRDLGQELGLTGQRVGQLFDQGLKFLREEVNRDNGQS